MRQLIILIALFLFFTVTTVAQSAYLISFTAGFTRYEGMLILDQKLNGIMRVKYYDKEREKTAMIEEKMMPQQTADGIRLAGYDVVYPGTTVRHQSYSADNFYLFYDVNGKMNMVNIDNYGVKANVSAIELTKVEDLKRYLIKYHWD